MEKKQLRNMIRQQGRKVNDEFYTLYKDCEKLFSQFDFSQMKVYCPCDSEKSNIVKYLKDKCKELKYTSDNYENHEDLFEWCDVIITNPPFSKFSKRYAYFRKFNKKFILAFPVMSCVNTDFLTDFKYNNLWICGRSSYFEDKEGVIANIKCGWITNLER